MPGLRSLVARRKSTLTTIGNDDIEKKITEKKSELKICDSSVEFTKSKWTIDQIFNMPLINVSPANTVSENKDIGNGQSDNAFQGSIENKSEKIGVANDIVPDVKLVSHSPLVDGDSEHSEINGKNNGNHNLTKDSNAKSLEPIIAKDNMTIANQKNAEISNGISPKVETHAEIKEGVTVPHELNEGKNCSNNSADVTVEHSHQTVMAQVSIVKEKPPKIDFKPKPLCKASHFPCSVMFNDNCINKTAGIKCPQCHENYTTDEMAVNLETKIAQFKCTSCQWLVVRQITNHSIE